jgi:hypothetical protein
MRKFSGVPPAREESFSFSRICKDQLDCGFGNVRGVVVRQKYGAAFVAAHEIAQAKFSVNDLAHPVCRGLGHVNPLAHLQTLRYGVLPGRANRYDIEKCRA